MTAQEMIDFLEPLGYSIKRKNGSHTILKNPGYESVVVIPTYTGKELNRSVLLSIKKNVVEKGVISEKEFIKALNSRPLHYS